MNRGALWLRRHGAATFGEIAVNFVAPVLIYDRFAPAHGDVVALLGSSAPPALWSLIEFMRRRRVDAISLMVLAGIVLSLLALVGGGSARFLQLRENLVTALVGIVFLGSAAIGRPIIYQFVRAGAARHSSDMAAAYAAKRNLPRFRRVMTIMTVVWGFGLLASTAAACALVYALSIHDYLIVGPFVGYGSMGALGAWTFWYARRAKRRGEALDAAAGSGRLVRE
ncbi:VC0807 family protein [Sphingomonas sp.]|uniref:VC0807 family protein n=1 Tax=Sphingomonas sp. TaxID=28214 RepID=UPI003B0032D6